MTKTTNIATRAELETRVKARATPEVEHHLTPGGSVETVVTQRIDAQNENRIQDLRSRLDNSHQTLRQDFSLSRMHGKAKVDFDRS
jgi:hypothetical protein